MHIAIDDKAYKDLKCKASSWETIENFFENEPVLKDIYKETVDECLRNNCQSTPVMIMSTVRKILEYAEID